MAGERSPEHARTPVEHALEIGIGERLTAARRHPVRVADEALLQRAALAQGGDVVVAGALADHLRRQMRRVERRQRALVGARVAGAHRSDDTVAPRLRGGPLDHVKPVRRLLGEWIPVAVRTTAAADVVDDDRISTARVPMAAARVARAVFQVWRAFDDGGDGVADRLAPGGRQVDVRRQLDAVAQRDANVRPDHRVELKMRAFPSGHRRCATYRDQRLGWIVTDRRRSVRCSRAACGRAPDRSATRGCLCYKCGRRRARTRAQPK